MTSQTPQYSHFSQPETCYKQTLSKLLRVDVRHRSAAPNPANAIALHGSSCLHFFLIRLPFATGARAQYVWLFRWILRQPPSRCPSWPPVAYAPHEHVRALPKPATFCFHISTRFTPRPPVEYLKPIHKKTLGPYSGVSK